MASPSSLRAVLNELEAAVRVRVPTVSFETGERSLAANGRPPRIVWVPRSGSFGPPEKRTNSPRSLWTHQRLVSVHIWGADFDQADSLMVDVIRCLHRAAYGSYSLQTSDDTQPDNADCGYALRLDVALLIPVTEAPLATVVPTSFQLVPGVAGDGVLEPGES